MHRHFIYTVVLHFVYNIIVPMCNALLLVKSVTTKIKLIGK